MYSYRDIQIIEEQAKIYTNGLKPLLEGVEFLCQKHRKNDHVGLMKYLIDYVVDYSPSIKDMQTISFYSWLFQFRQTQDGHFFEIFEPLDDTGENYIQGADKGLMIVSAQEEQCRIQQVKPAWPQFTQKIVISKGVYEGDPLHGIRYPSPSGMCGWWLTTDRYDNDVKSLMTVHYYHVVFSRLDIVALLALPHGFSFDTKKRAIWYSEDVANEPF